jgi:hypothetical protein
MLPKTILPILEFDQNEIQIPEIIKKIKPESCWEELWTYRNANFDGKIEW